MDCVVWWGLKDYRVTILATWRLGDSPLQLATSRKVAKSKGDCRGDKEGKYFALIDHRGIVLGYHELCHVPIHY